MNSVTEALTQIITWMGTVIDGLMTGAMNPLLPLFAVGIAISVLLLGVKIIKTFIWGS